MWALQFDSRSRKGFVGVAELSQRAVGIRRVALLGHHAGRDCRRHRAGLPVVAGDSKQGHVAEGISDCRVRQAAARQSRRRLVGLVETHGTPHTRTTAEGDRRLQGQQRDDGGWSLTTLAAWTPRRDDAPFESQSDGYATGLVTFALQQAGVRAQKRTWAKGSPGWWRIGTDRRPVARVLAEQTARRGTDIGQFMSDGGTALRCWRSPPISKNPGDSRPPGFRFCRNGLGRVGSIQQFHEGHHVRLVLRRQRDQRWQRPGPSKSVTKAKNLV